jgi:hypothetical protein
MLLDVIDAGDRHSRLEEQIGDDQAAVAHGHTHASTFRVDEFFMDSVEA